MSDSTTRQRILQAAVEWKEALVRRDGVGEDLPPTLALVRDGVFFAYFLVPWSDEAERDVMLLKMTFIVAASDATQAVFTTESFMHTTQSLRSYEFGEFARRFAAGDDTIAEAVLVFSAGLDGHCAITSRPYRYAGRTVEWLDTVTGDDADTREGAVNDALRRGFEMQPERPIPALTPTEIAAAAEVDMVMPLLSPSPPRNEPCPCGSGGKAKHCCWDDQRR